MHDPQTVAFEIRYPWRAYPKAERTDSFRRNYRRSFITIWHVDPERDGTDDSCGWFKRARHGSKTVLEAIRKAFAYEWQKTYGGWFDATGRPQFTSQALALMMFRRAALIHFGVDDNAGRAWRRAERFIQRNLASILFFAENDTDTLHDGFITLYSAERRDDQIASTAACIYGWILRAEQRWYQHARWHFWHWKIQVHPALDFKRWAFSRCAGCGRRFKWGYAPVTFSWNGGGPRWFHSESGVYHTACANFVTTPAVKDYKPGVTTSVN